MSGARESLRPRRLPRRPRPPLWLQWTVSLAVAAAALVALVLFVNANNTQTLAVQSPKAVARANREADILTAQDQAPHLVTIAPGRRGRTAAGDALVAAIRGDMRLRVPGGLAPGALQRASCTASGGSPAAPTFSCVATVADENYMYVGVVHVRDHTLVLCRRDAPPVPGEPIPLSLRCLR